MTKKPSRQEPQPVPGKEVTQKEKGSKPKRDPFEIFDTALEALGEQLEQGYSIGFSDYLRFLSQFHHYSLTNILAIHSQCPDASHVAGFQQWKKLGRSVTKGEKGLAIVVPYRRKVEDKEPGEEEKRITGYGRGFVFDVSQTQGRPLPEQGAIFGDGEALIPSIENAYASLGIRLEYDAVPLGPVCRGASCIGLVYVRPELEPNLKARVLLHELAHEVAHTAEERGSLPKKQRELEAEAIAFAVGYACRLDMREFSSDYVLNHGNDREALKVSLTRIRNASHTILELIDPKQVLRRAA